MANFGIAFFLILVVFALMDPVDRPKAYWPAAVAFVAIVAFDVCAHAPWWVK